MEKPWKGDTMLNRKILVLLLCGGSARLYCAMFERRLGAVSASFA